MYIIGKKCTYKHKFNRDLISNHNNNLRNYKFTGDHQESIPIHFFPTKSSQERVQTKLDGQKLD